MVFAFSGILLLAFTATRATGQEAGDAPLTRSEAMETPIEVRHSTGVVRELPQLDDESPPANDVTSGGRRLVHLDWRDFEKKLIDIWGQTLRARPDNADSSRIRVELPAVDGPPNAIIIDRNLNTVTFEGPETNAPVWNEMVQLIDISGEEPEVVRLVGMGKAEPAVVRSAATLLGIQEDTTPALKRADDLAPFRFARTSNVASGTARPGFAGSALPAAFVQENAEPRQQELPNDPTRILEMQDDFDLKGTVQIKILDEFGTIVLIGDPEDTAKLRTIIENLVRAADVAQPEVRLFPLNNADSSALKPIIDNVYETMYATGNGPINVTALESPNALLVIGRPGGMLVVAELVRQLDISTPPDAEGTLDFRVFRLEHMSAVDAGLKLRGYFWTGEAENDTVDSAQWIASLHGPVAIITDYRSNSLIVKGNAAVLQRAANLIAELDVVKTETRDIVRVFNIHNALAVDLAIVLQNAINGGLSGSPQPFAPGSQQQFGLQQQNQGALAQARAAMLEIMTLDGEGRIASGILFDVRVTANGSSNQLIVTGPEESMDLVAELVRQMDRIPDAETQIKVFEILNGDANQLLNMLQTLFGQTQGGFQQGGFGQGQFNSANLPLQSAASTPGGALVNLRFSVDPRTNTIIVTGPAGDLQTVEDLLYRLDEQDQDNRLVTTVRLKNAFADDLAIAINEWLDLRQEVIDVDPNNANPFVTARRQVIVVAEGLTNSLIVSATPAYYDDVIRLINELDTRPPMVRVKVLIAEILLDDLSEFGVEFGIQDSLLFDRGVGVIGFPFNQAGIGNNNNALSLSTREMLAGQGLSNLNVGRTNSDLGYGGLVLSAGNESITVLLRALENRGLVRVMSAPDITTLETLQGRVQVGSKVSRITGASTTGTVGATGLVTEVVDTDIGIILAITPRVSPDGMIIMNVDAVNSSLGSEAQGTPVFVSDGQIVRSPPINITQAQSTIMARSGQTVAFSGLIQDTQTKEHRGTPILSDLPVLGPLFSYESESHRRTELLIILTPYLVDSKEQIDANNQVQMDRMHWCLADVADIYGAVGYGMFDPENIGSGIPGMDVPATYYPDQDPAGMYPEYLPLEPGADRTAPATGDPFMQPTSPNPMDRYPGTVPLVPARPMELQPAPRGGVDNGPVGQPLSSQWSDPPNSIVAQTAAHGAVDIKPAADHNTAPLPRIRNSGGKPVSSDNDEFSRIANPFYR